MGGSAFVDDFHLIAFQDGDIHELALRLAAVMFDHDQAGRRHFHHKHKLGMARVAPHTARPTPAPPNAQVDSRAFHRRRNFGQNAGVERKRALKQ